MKPVLLFLDDMRNPFVNPEFLPKELDVIVHWVTNYAEFVAYITKHGIPAYISFDHDLADEHHTPEYFWNDYDESKKFQEWKKKTYCHKTGEDCAKFLISYNKNLVGTSCFVHSANPVGADWIKDILTPYFKTTILNIC